MSNTELPAYLQQYQAPVSDVDALADVRTSVPRVSLKGKRFKFIDGDDESRGSDSIEVAILAVEPQGSLLNKVFYKGGYNPNESAPPDCASSNGINPDPWVNDPVHHKCDGCPKNVFGSAMNDAGKKTKACKDSKVLWVAKPDDIGGTVYGLKIPVTSLKAMGVFGKTVRQMGAPLAAVLTRLSMDQDKEWPQVEFEVAGFLDQEQGVLAIERSSQREWIDNTTPVALEAPAKTEKIEHKPRESVTIDHEADAPKDTGSQSDAFEKAKAGW